MGPYRAGIVLADPLEAYAQSFGFEFPLIPLTIVASSLILDYYFGLHEALFL